MNKRALFAVLLTVLFGLSAKVGAQEGRFDFAYTYLTSNTLINALNSQMTFTAAVANSAAPTGYTLDAGEPVPTCLPEGAVQLASAWTLIAFQGGKFTLDTNESTYDTIVQVYNYATSYANLIPVGKGCARQGQNGIARARLKMKLAAGLYLVQISEEVPFDGTPSVDRTLRLLMTDEPNPKVPKADNFVDSPLLKQGLAFRQTNVEHASRSSEDDFTPSCATANLYRSSLWYRFVAPADGLYRFAMYKFTTGFIPFGGTPNVIFAMYNHSETEIGCLWKNAATPHSLPALQMLEGDTVYLLVMPEQNYFPISPTSFKLKVTTEWAAFPFDPYGFESQLLDGHPWKVSGGTENDTIVCGAGAPTPCVYMTGGDSKPATLKGKYKWPAGFGGVKGDVFTFKAEFAATENVLPGRVKLKLQIVYSDGTPTTTATLTPPHFSAAVWLPLQVSATLASGKVSAVIVSLQNKNTAGFLYVDVPALYYFGEVARARDVLPLPAPPQ